MEIEMLADREIKLPSGAKQVFKAGWSGDAPDADAARWVGEGAARRVASAPAAAVALTPRQTAILARAADQIDAMQNGAAAAVPASDDGETGEAGEPGDDGDDGEEVDLTTKSLPELRDLATRLGVKWTPKTSRDTLISKIVAAAEAHSGEPA